jgi:hypothetical protein
MCAFLLSPHQTIAHDEKRGKQPGACGPRTFTPRPCCLHTVPFSWKKLPPKIAGSAGSPRDCSSQVSACKRRRKSSILVTSLADQPRSATAAAAGQNRLPTAARAVGSSGRQRRNQAGLRTEPRLRDGGCKGLQLSLLTQLDHRQASTPWTEASLSASVSTTTRPSSPSCSASNAVGSIV